MRALWAKVMPTQQHLRAAYSLDSGSQELVYVAGPLLATGAVLLSGPSVALGLTAGLGLAGALVVALSPSSRSWMPAPRKRHDPLGALRPLEARVLLLALVAVGSALGALNVAALAASERHAASWMAGAVPAAVSIGALIGSALYAGRRWPGSDATHLAWAAGGFVLAWLPLCLDPAPLMTVALAVVPGVFFGPLLTASYLVLDQATPPSCTVEAFGWLVGAFGVGTALGQAAAGAGNGTWAGPTAAAAIAFGLLLLIRRLTDKTRPLH
ncbi:hypothetical protein [Streptomyces sp. NPDC058548]|uniref:hypothetical protein n=1 Tax=Streptomyces sp. NPDC058548 TaxID=3346545 RepID=UPI003667D1E2